MKRSNSPGLIAAGKISSGRVRHRERLNGFCFAVIVCACSVCFCSIGSGGTCKTGGGWAKTNYTYNRHTGLRRTHACTSNSVLQSLSAVVEAILHGAA